MTYPEAQAAAAKGALIAMKKWNGKGMYCFAVSGFALPVEQITNAKARESFEAVQLDTVNVNPLMCMVGADGNVTAGWAPSQLDMFSNQWIEVHPM